MKARKVKCYRCKAALMLVPRAKSVWCAACKTNTPYLRTIKCLRCGGKVQTYSSEVGYEHRKCGFTAVRKTNQTTNHYRYPIQRDLYCLCFPKSKETHLYDTSKTRAIYGDRIYIDSHLNTMVMILNQCLPPDFNDLDWLEKVMLLQ